VSHLSQSNLALNRFSLLGEKVFAPGDLANLAAWYDPTQSDYRTVDGTDLQELDNAVDPANNGELDDDVTGSSSPQWGTTSPTGLPLFEVESSTDRCLAGRQLAYSGYRVGSDPFRFFIVFSTEDSANVSLFQNGAQDAAGGGFNVRFNAGGANEVRWMIQDSTNTDTYTDTVAGAFDGDLHVLMLGRKAGTPNVLRVRLDLTVFDSTNMTAGFGAAENDGSINAAAGYFFLGAAAAAPASGQKYMDGFIGEVLLYKNDLSDGEEVQVMNYLMNRWGVA
jgi:hypothetical protein